MATVIVEIVDASGKITTQELQDWQVDILRQNNIPFTQKSDEPVVIPPDIQTLLTGIEKGEFEVPQWFIDVEVVNIKNGNITPDRFRRQWQQGLASGVIKSKIGTVITSYNYSTPYGTFSTQAETEKEAQEQKEEFVKVQESLEQERIQKAIEESRIELEAKQQEELDKIKKEFELVPKAYAEEMDLEKPIIGDDTQVSQSIGAWEIVGNRVKGEILFIAQNSFNPYYYNKSVVHLLQIKNKDGIVLGMKTNDLTFSDLQRDERLTFDENAEFNKELIIESYVWSSVQDSLALSTKKEFSVVETVKVVTDPETGEQLTVAQSQTRVKPDKRNDWLGKATGIFAGLAGISLLLGDRGK